MLQIDQNKCAGCGICITQCPVGAIFMRNNKAHIATEKCAECGQCARLCPREAIQTTTPSQSSLATKSGQTPRPNRRVRQKTLRKGHKK